jgi:hypothetical protein
MSPEVTRWLRTPAGELTAGELIDLQLAVASRIAENQLATDPAERKAADKSATLAGILTDAA